ncbi:MAG TPA: hypothetical protein VIX63_11380 [Vicinamibacterales bacterium]
MALGLSTQCFAQERSTVAHTDLPRLQSLVNDLRERLSIRHSVTVSLVPSNALMMSVEAPAEPSGAFRLSIEASFLDVLSGDELEAAIAHELGHVWVFTHHPFLQTEQLANEIAMRVVSRDTLERVYEKVWKRGDTKGDLARFLGPEPAVGLASTNQTR